MALTAPLASLFLAMHCTLSCKYMRNDWDFFQDGVVGSYLRSRLKKTSCFQIGFWHLSNRLDHSTYLPASHHGEILLFARKRAAGDSEEAFVLACTYPTVKRVFGLDVVDISTSKRRLAWLPAVVVGRCLCFWSRRFWMAPDFNWPRLNEWCCMQRATTPVK